MLERQIEISGWGGLRMTDFDPWFQRLFHIQNRVLLMSEEALCQRFLA